MEYWSPAVCKLSFPHLVCLYTTQHRSPFVWMCTSTRLLFTFSFHTINICAPCKCYLCMSSQTRACWIYCWPITSARSSQAIPVCPCRKVRDTVMAPYAKMIHKGTRVIVINTQFWKSDFWQHPQAGVHSAFWDLLTFAFSKYMGDATESVLAGINEYPMVRVSFMLAIVIFCAL